MDSSLNREQGPASGEMNEKSPVVTYSEKIRSLARGIILQQKGLERANRIRAKQMMHLGVSFGADSGSLSRYINSLLKTASKFLMIDLTKNEESQDAESIELIEEVGRHFIPKGSPHEKKRYIVGLKAISLLRENVTGFHFIGLKKWIERHTR